MKYLEKLLSNKEKGIKKKTKERFERNCSVHFFTVSTSLSLRYFGCWYFNRFFSLLFNIFSYFLFLWFKMFMWEIQLKTVCIIILCLLVRKLLLNSEFQRERERERENQNESEWTCVYFHFVTFLDHCLAVHCYCFSFCFSCYSPSVLVEKRQNWKGRRVHFSVLDKNNCCCCFDEQSSFPCFYCCAFWKHVLLCLKFNLIDLIWIYR